MNSAGESLRFCSLPVRVPGCGKLFEDIRLKLFQYELVYRDSHIMEANSWEEFEKLLDEKAGFISAHWDGEAETEAAINEKTRATIRSMWINNPRARGKSILPGLITRFSLTYVIPMAF